MTLVHHPEQRAVLFKATVDRVIRNITGQTTQIRVDGGTDEWFNPLQRAEITTAEYRRYKDQKYGPAEQLQIKRLLAGITYGTEHLVDIAPDELIHLAFAYEVVCPDHGQETLSYRYPIECPSAHVEVPSTLRAHLAISHRDPAHPYSDWETGYLTSRLNGTLLPHQDIHVLWHRADDLDKAEDKRGDPAAFH